MHKGNRDWLQHLRLRYKEYFNKAKVLEVGSYNVNGEAREYFKDCEYVGVDKEKGLGVDVVCEAVNTKFKPNYFDTFVCMSAFEHDPNWDKGFKHNMQWVRKNGLFVVAWGAEGNLLHPPVPWGPIPSGLFLEKVKAGWPLRILDYFFEQDRYPDSAVKGVFNVLAIKK